MKIFLSWSGNRGKAIAEALYQWLPCVIQAVRPFISTNITKGKRGLVEIATELEASNIGIVCVTPESKEARWLLFEAGALSKTQTVALVCTYLVDLDSPDLEPPLSQFQHTRASDKEDTFKLLVGINDQVDEKARLAASTLRTVFDTFWPDLGKKIAALPAPDLAPPPKRESDDILRELLEIARGLQLSNSELGMQIVRLSMGQRSLRPLPRPTSSPLSGLKMAGGVDVMSPANRQALNDAVAHLKLMGQTISPAQMSEMARAIDDLDGVRGQLQTEEIQRLSTHLQAVFGQSGVLSPERLQTLIDTIEKGRLAFSR